MKYPGTWRRIEPTTVDKIGYRTIVGKTFEMPDGATAVFHTMHPEGTHLVNAVALTPDNQVILVRQFRAGPEKIMHELPGGFVDEGEEPVEAVIRELMEETGYVPGEIEELGTTQKDAYLNGTWHGFFMTNCELKGIQELDEGEHIEVELVSIDQLLEHARNGDMTDTHTVLLAYERLLKLKETNNETTN